MNSDPLLVPLIHGMEGIKSGCFGSEEGGPRNTDFQPLKDYLPLFLFFSWISRDRQLGLLARFPISFKS